MLKTSKSKKKRKSDWSRNDTALLNKSTDIKLLSEIEIKVRNGTVLSIADIEVTFRDILENECCTRGYRNILPEKISKPFVCGNRL